MAERSRESPYPDLLRSQQSCPEVFEQRLEEAVKSYIHVRSTKVPAGHVGCSPAPTPREEEAAGDWRRSVHFTQAPTLEEPMAEAPPGAGQSTQTPPVPTTSSVQSVRSTGATNSKAEANVKRLYSSANVKAELCLDSAEDADSLKALEKATFRDARWQNALQHMRETGTWNDSAAVQRLIRQGAKSFGLWHLPEEALEALAKHVLQEEAIISPALQAWTRSLAEGGANMQSKVLQSRHRAASSVSKRGGTKERLSGRRSWLLEEGNGIKVALSVIIFLLAVAYCMKVVIMMYPGAIGVFGWPIAVARAGGCAALLWTALLFLTMSRTALRFVMRFVPLRIRWVHEIADCHKELHIFCGKMLLVTGFIHGIAHCIGTVPGIETHSAEELNELLGCANRDSTPGYINAPMRWLTFPRCPFEKQYSFQDILFKSMPGLSGLALLVIICLVAYTGRQDKRTAHFDIFWYVHNAAIPLWLLFLFAHGSNGWVGVGFPLVTVVCGFPVFLYSIDRVGRLLRYYCFTGGKVRIVDVVIRPGQTDPTKGGLVHLSITRPPCLWSRAFRSGMYAFLCMPEYAPLQWHPFTICSGQDDEKVDFIVAGLGDWTEELARRCWKYYEEGGSLPKIAMDGPYLSPTTTALSREVLIAVGAGVGVTPLLSLMSTIIAVLERDDEDEKRSSLPLKEAHFFWMTRSADELLFGRQHFTKIVSSPRLRDKVFLHLHVTHRAADRDVSAFLFREAVRRQSDIDYKAFQTAAKDLPATDLITGAQLPWCWVNGSKQDLLWVGSLVESSDAQSELQVVDAHTKHWATGVANRSSSLDTQKEDNKDDIQTRFGQSKARRTGLFSMPSTVGCDAKAVNMAPSGLDTYVPVTFGRPDFAKEVRAVGKARPGHDVYVYVCGNDALVKSLQSVCKICNEHAQAAIDEGSEEPPQKYKVHYERFG